MWVFTYMCGSFQLLDAALSWRMMRALYFAPHFVSVGVLLTLLATGHMLRRWAHAASKPGVAGTSAGRARQSAE
jgi:hypothetical protein